MSRLARTSPATMSFDSHGRSYERTATSPGMIMTASIAGTPGRRAPARVGARGSRGAARAGVARQIARRGWPTPTMAPMTAPSLRVALVQTDATDDPAANVARAAELADEAARDG